MIFFSVLKIELLVIGRVLTERYYTILLRTN
jgi:hypothetical protein